MEMLVYPSKGGKNFFPPKITLKKGESGNPPICKLGSMFTTYEKERISGINLSSKIPHLIVLSMKNHCLSSAIKQLGLFEQTSHSSLWLYYYLLHSSHGDGPDEIGAEVKLHSRDKNLSWKYILHPNPLLFVYAGRGRW